VAPLAGVNPSDPAVVEMVVVVEVALETFAEEEEGVTRTITSKEGIRVMSMQAGEVDTNKIKVIKTGNNLVVAGVGIRIIKAVKDKVGITGAVVVTKITGAEVVMGMMTGTMAISGVNTSEVVVMDMTTGTMAISGDNTSEVVDVGTVVEEVLVFKEVGLATTNSCYNVLYSLYTYNIT